jgi:hypothetical protein
MIAETRSTDDRGRLLVARRAGDDADRAALRREATMLGLACHPGVVGVVRADPLGDELVTAAPTRSSLAELQDRPDEALRALAATCETVADLHALGIVHGAITAEAILVTAGRPPVLDGFGRAGLAGEPGPDGAHLRPADDVAALAALVGQVWECRLPRRAARARGAPTRSDLDHLLADAADGRTPPARRLARTLEAALGPTTDLHAVDQTAPDDPGRPTEASDADDPFARLRPQEVEPPRRRPPRLVALAAGVVGVAALTWGVLGLGSGSGPAPRLDASATTTAPAPQATAPQATAAIGRRRPGPVLVAHHGVLVIGARRYLVGGRDDQAMAGDWECAGRTRVVLLRPATGELFVFAAWARAGNDVRATLAGQVAAGSRLSRASDAAGCSVARAIAPDGTSHVVRIGPG